MSFDSDVLAMVRVELDDYITSDDELLMRVYSAAYIVVFDLGGYFPYVVNVVDQTISPDPSGDINFAVLTAYKTAELMALAALREDAVTAGVSVKLGPAFVSRKDANAAANRVQYYADLYLRSKIDLLAALAGGAILSPASLVNGGGA